MKTMLCAFVFILVSLLNGKAQQSEDVVYLKNGSVIHGTLLEINPEKNLKIQNRIGDIFVFNMADVEKVTKETFKSSSISENLLSNSTATTTNNSRKLYPGLSFLFSVIVPGGGQYYNDQIAKGVIFTSIDVLSVVGYYVFLKRSQNYENEQNIFYNNSPSNNTNLNYAYYCLGVGLLDDLVSIIDAPISAHSINKRNKLCLNYFINKHINLALSPDYHMDDYSTRLTAILGAKLSIQLQ